jgi:hypothetical protein
MRVLAIVLIGLLLVACAHQPLPPEVAPTNLPGFWYGVFHGATAVFSLIGSYFYDVRIYAFPNNGGWYDFGYVIGLLLVGGGEGGGGVHFTWHARRR